LINNLNQTFLADESCDFAIIRALRAEGFYVVSVAESYPALVDEKILEIAYREKRLLLTEDKDFGEWVFSHGKQMCGIVLFRYPARLRHSIANLTVELVKEHGLSLINNFTVIEPGRARIRHKTG
jgi:predicted nuclease of predicted toxin-antitoxin system